MLDLEGNRTRQERRCGAPWNGPVGGRHNVPCGDATTRHGGAFSDSIRGGRPPYEQVLAELTGKVASRAGNVGSGFGGASYVPPVVRECARSVRPTPTGEAAPFVVVSLVTTPGGRTTKTASPCAETSGA